MLSSLSIRNFILIESADLEFEPGFTVITGETGAGKSIIIDALLCALGERSQGDIIKKGADKGFVEAIFTVSTSLLLPEELIAEGYIESMQDATERTIIIRREFTAKGVNRSFINDSPATASMARSLGEVLIDFHGQHDHQSLLKVESHLSLLDDVADIEHEKNAYIQQKVSAKTIYDHYINLLARKDDIIRNKEQIAFALNEIEQIQPGIQELQELETEFSKIKHSVYIQDKIQLIHSIFSDDQSSLMASLGKLRNALTDLASIDPDYTEMLKELASAHASLDEIFRVIQSKQSEESRVDPDIIQERIAKLVWLKKKYGSIEHVFEVWEELRQEVTLSEDIDGEITRLAEQLQKARITLGNKARTVSKKRIAVIKSTEQHIELMLKSMGIASPTFTIKSHQTMLEDSEQHDHIAIIDDTYYVAHHSGIDSIEFLISLNPGEELKPLIKAASGGEISRIMLSLKSLINQKTGIPSMVFDEIDTGISGKIARKVGGVMQELGQNKQIIAISHSPQIASLAHHHILVHKSTSNASTNVHARILSGEERITEIATLLSGEHITQTSLSTAMELLASEDTYQGKKNDTL